MSNAHEYRWLREHRASLVLFYLQCLFFVMALACMILIVWNPLNWLQIAVTIVLLLLAGAACKSGRQ